MKKDHWILIVFILTFILSIIFSTVSNLIAISFNNIVLIIILLLTIGLGILFDIIGTATITAKESTFHSLNSKRIKGAKAGIKLIRNQEKISSFCNDIIGDICGIISGSIGAILAISLSTTFSLNNTIISIILAALISSMTVGGKAIFKVVAINNSDKILLTVSRFISIFGGIK